MEVFYCHAVPHVEPVKKTRLGRHLGRAANPRYVPLPCRLILIRRGVLSVIRGGDGVMIRTSALFS